MNPIAVCFYFFELLTNPVNKAKLLCFSYNTGGTNHPQPIYNTSDFSRLLFIDQNKVGMDITSAL